MVLLVALAGCSEKTKETPATRCEAAATTRGEAATTGKKAATARRDQASQAAGRFALVYSSGVIAASRGPSSYLEIKPGKAGFEIRFTESQPKLGGAPGTVDTDEIWKGNAQ